METVWMTVLISGVVAVATAAVSWWLKDRRSCPKADLYNVYANVLDYGADPRGKKDSSNAVKKALENNKLVFFPSGTYLMDQVEICGSVTLQGAGSNATVIKARNLTGNVFSFSGDNWHLKDMKFVAEDYRTEGAYIFSNGRDGSIENVSIEQHYVGFDLDGAININIINTTARCGTPHCVAKGGAAIRLGNTKYTGQVNIRGMFAWPATRVPNPTVAQVLELQPSTAITMKYVDVVAISDTLLIGHTKDVLIAPGKDQFAALIEITDCCFDTAQSGLCMEPTDGGRVLRNGFANTWFGAHTGDGVVIDGTDGTVPGAQFTNCMFMGNGGDGVKILGKGVNGIYFSNCFSSSNACNGLTVAQKAQNAVWSGGVIGASHEAGPNLNYGFRVEDGCSGRIMLTDLRGNTLGAGNNPGECVILLNNIVV